MINLSKCIKNRKNYIKVLIHCGFFSCIKIYSFFKLKIYREILKIKCKIKIQKIVIIRLITLINFGKITLVEKIIFKNSFNKKNLTFFVENIFYLSPKLSLKIIKEKIGFDKNNLLHIILEYYAGDKNIAFKHIKNLYKKKNFIQINKETILYYSNFFANSNLEKLYLLNKYLDLFNLNKLLLKNYNSSLNITNLYCNTKSLVNIKYDKKVSIIMTTYNSSTYIENALQSLLNQTYENIEIIVVDDNSKDDTVDKICKFVEVDKRIKLIKIPINVGTYVAKNIALNYVEGDFITCHDSDDFSHPLKIELQLEPLLLDKKKTASISYWLRIDENGYCKNHYLYPLLRLNLSSFMYKKEVIKKIGFYDPVRTGADNEFYHRVEFAFGKDSIIKIKKPLAFASYRDDSLTNHKLTGYKSNKLLDTRQIYWENWNKFLINCERENIVPYIPQEHNLNRMFEAPEELKVEYNDILFAISNSKIEG